MSAPAALGRARAREEGAVSRARTKRNMAVMHSSATVITRPGENAAPSASEKDWKSRIVR